MARLSKAQKEELIQQHMKLLKCSREEAESVLADDILIDSDRDNNVSYRGSWTNDKWNFSLKDVYRDINRRKEIKRLQRRIERIKEIRRKTK